MVEQPNHPRSYDLDNREQGIAGNRHRPRPYAFGRSAQQDDDHGGDSVPLFLSDPDSEPNPAEFGYEARLRTPRRFSISTKILMATVVASSVAVMFAWFSSDAMRDVLTSARASIATVLPVRSAAARTDAPAQQLTPGDAQLKGPTQRSGSANQAPGVTRNPQLATLPSREEISTAYQAALQNRAPATTPQAGAAPLAAVSPVAVVPSAAPSPARQMDAGELATLMQRAKGFLDSGDLPSARLLLERAADAQDVSAVLLLAQTYDPDVLGTSDVRNVVPEPAKARAWYQKAAQLGSADAQRRLAQLPN